MFRAIAQVVLNGLAIVLVARLVPGIEYQGDIGYLLLTGLVVGLVNLLVKPIVTLLSLPFIVLSLGLFYLVINALMLYLVAGLLDGLTVQGCIPALLGGLILALLNWIIRLAVEKE